MDKCLGCGKKLNKNEWFFIQSCDECLSNLDSNLYRPYEKPKNSFLNKIKRFWKWFNEGCENG